MNQDRKKERESGEQATATVTLCRRLGKSLCMRVFVCVVVEGFCGAVNALLGSVGVWLEERKEQAGC